MTCSWLRPSRPSTQREHDPVGGIGAGRRAVGDVDRRSRREVAARAADAVLDAAPDRRLEGVAGVEGGEDVHRARQCAPPSKDLIIWIWPAAAVVGLKPNWKSNT